MKYFLFEKNRNYQGLKDHFNPEKFDEKLNYSKVSKDFSNSKILQ